MDERPRRFKVYSPSGMVEEVVGVLHLTYRPPTSDPQLPEECRLAFSPLGGPMCIFNGRVVVVDMETDRVVYNPRKPPQLPPWAGKHVRLLTETERTWLAEHKEWPAILELDWDEVGEFGWEGLGGE